MNTLTNQERDAILAGLRMLQAHLYNVEIFNRDIWEIATNEGRHMVLGAEGIDALCERLNT